MAPVTVWLNLELSFSELSLVLMFDTLIIMINFVVRHKTYSFEYCKLIGAANSNLPTGKYNYIAVSPNLPLYTEVGQAKLGGTMHAQRLG